MRYHFIGIKGSGMSALAIVLKGLGHKVKGSDYSTYIFTEDLLVEEGIEIYEFNVNNLEDVDVVIVGHNFMESDNVEYKEAKRKNMKIVEYHIALSTLIKNYCSIAISGSNGKTTTTGLIASVLNEVEDTSYLIGSGEGKGRKSKYFTFEACEYKNHFLEYKPNIVLVNNIDYDHVDYFKEEKDYVKAFYNFINNSKNIVVVNGDDKHLKCVNNVISFGLDSNCLIRAKNVKYDNGISYDLYYKDNYIDRIELDFYGKHMVYNTLACISVCMSVGIDMINIKNGLKKFKGVKQRFEETIINGDVYIDDYAHHPSKINAIIDAVKQKYKNKKVIAFFRPDRVSRLDYFASLFVSSLKRADEFYILPFNSSNNEEITSYKNFMREYNLKELSEETYLEIARKKDVVYLMMSSKNMDEVKSSIIKYKG